MAQILIRNLDDSVKSQLRRRAQRHHRSMEEEARDILRNALRKEDAPAVLLGDRVKARFAGIGLDFDIAEQRGAPVRPVDFND
jgi:plasmid stability protein